MIEKLTMRRAPGYRLTLDRPTGAQLLAFIVTSDPDGLPQLLPPEVIQEAGFLLARAVATTDGRDAGQQRRWGLEKRVLTSVAGRATVRAPLPPAGAGIIARAPAEPPANHHIGQSFA